MISLNLLFTSGFKVSYILKQLFRLLLRNRHQLRVELLNNDWQNEPKWATVHHLCNPDPSPNCLHPSLEGKSNRLGK